MASNCCRDRAIHCETHNSNDAIVRFEWLQSMLHSSHTFVSISLMKIFLELRYSLLMTTRLTFMMPQYFEMIKVKHLRHAFFYRKNGWAENWHLLHRTSIYYIALISAFDIASCLQSRTCMHLCHPITWLHFPNFDITRKIVRKVMAQI